MRPPKRVESRSPRRRTGESGYLVCPASTATYPPEGYKTRGAWGISLAAVGRHIHLPSRPSHLSGVAPLGVLSAAFSLLLLLHSLYSPFCLPASAVARCVPSLGNAGNFPHLMVGQAGWSGPRLI